MNNPFTSRIVCFTLQFPLYFWWINYIAISDQNIPLQSPHISISHIPLYDLQCFSERDQALIKKVKKYMPTLAEHLMMLKDQLTKFDKILGEFIMIMKQNMPKGVEQINTYEELLELFDKIKKNKPEAKHGRVLNVYTKVRDCIKATAAEFEDHIMHTLLQVHAHCESSYQQQLKSKMRSAIREMNTHLQPSYNFYNLNHKEWQSKVLFKEQKLFLGPISVLAKSVSTLVDADVQMDEYLSSLTVKIKV